MFHILPIFSNAGKLLSAGIYNTDIGEYEHLNVDKPGVGTMANEACERKNKIRQIFLESYNEPVITSDFKSCLATFNLPLTNRRYDIYDTNISIPDNTSDEVLFKLTKAKFQPSKWQHLLANAAVVYYDIEQRGICHNGEWIYPKWSLKTFSGRSSTSGHNVQGGSEEDDYFLYSSKSKMIHFDWAAADLRAAQLLSGDPELGAIFNSGDPYDNICKLLNDGAASDECIERTDCKQACFQCIYSFDLENPILEIFNVLREWMVGVSRDFESKQYMMSKLGRKYRVNEEGRSVRSVFNAVMQGTVAHAMHSAIRRAWELYKDYLMLETHDSITFNCPNDRKMMAKIITDVRQIMQEPFYEILPENPKFVVNTYVGDRFKKWKLLNI